MKPNYYVVSVHPKNWPEPWKFLSCNQVAEYFSVAPQTIRNWAAENPDFPPSVNMGDRLTRWLDLDIQKFIEHQKGKQYE